VTDYRRDHLASARNERLAALDPWRAQTAAGMLEDSELLPQVQQLCKQLRVLVYHTHRSDLSEPGFPDIVAAGNGGLLFRELKTEKGAVSEAQQLWLGQLEVLGYDVGVWRPSDLLSGRIAEQLAAIRSTQQEASA
jgi:hypothetical protein